MTICRDNGGSSIKLLGHDMWFCGGGDGWLYRVVERWQTIGGTAVGGGASFRSVTTTVESLCQFR
ncbi:hypothetical protein HanRHA438_Chr01g0040531 [Helianthus annuus]|nr:hypothetical protein HanIR_Chr01g0043981 [Helianthus annuus]KAJ0949610.1 hypothetical protein HanRHA438_Chr01g0040531 [Helianthus annuus]